MINYYFKYLELLDTVFLALKKKPLGMSPLGAFRSFKDSIYIIKLSCMFSTTLRLLCYVLRNSMGRPVWYIASKVKKMTYTHYLLFTVMGRHLA